MTLFESPIAWAAAVLALLLLLVLIVPRRRGHARPRAQREALDTVAAWPPAAACVMTAQERQAHDLLRKALPGHTVLAQVPLSRFLRVPTRHSYGDWLQRVGLASADLLVCDAASRVLAVVDIRCAGESARSRRRHERMGEVLRAARIAVLVWQAECLPTVEQARTQIIPVLQEFYGRGAAPMPQHAAASTSQPLIPVADVEELLAAGDGAYAQNDEYMEPVPSTLFDDFSVPAAAAGGSRP